MSSSDSVRSTFRSGTVSAGRVQNLLDEPDRVPKSQFFDHFDRLNGVLLGATKLGFGYSVEHASTSGKDQAGVGGFCRDRGNSRSFSRSSVSQAQSFKPNSSSIEPIELLFIAYIHEKLVMAFKDKLMLPQSRQKPPTPA